MGLSIQIKNGKHCPILTCDKCGQPIEEMEKAIVLTPNAIGKPIIPVQGIYHKGICDPERTILSEEGQKEYMLCDHLDEYIPWLILNHKWGTLHTTRHGVRLMMYIPYPREF
jgi:hypothetical protein